MIRRDLTEIIKYNLKCVDGDIDYRANHLCDAIMYYLRTQSTKVTSAGEITEDGIMRNTPWNG